MIRIEGKKVEKDFGDFIKISDLIFFDGPLLSHFISPVGDNYLFYWCDVNDLYNRWIIIRTDLNLIQQYIEKKISLRDIVTQPIDGFVYIADIDEEVNYNSVQLLLKEEIPIDYIPNEDSFYNFDVKDSESLASLSQKYDSGILEIHISGKDVRYGSIPLGKFAQLLPKIEEVRKGMASKFIRDNKSKQTDKDKNQSKIKELKLDTQYEYMYSLAGSIRVIMKPLNNQKHLDFSGFRTYADIFAEDFTGLIASGLSKDSILRYSNKYNKQIIKKYNDLVKFLFEESLSIGVKWCNIGTDINYSTTIGRGQTREILDNLSNFDFDETETIDIVGRFYSLNIRSGSYSFESIEDDDFKSTGFLDDKLKQFAYGISFSNIYNVVIERKCLEPIGQKKQIKDKIISFVKVSE